MLFGGAVFRNDWKDRESKAAIKDIAQVASLPMLVRRELVLHDLRRAKAEAKFISENKFRKYF